MKLLPVCILALLLTSCTRVNVFPQDESAGATATPTAQADSGKKADSDDPFKPWDEVLKDTKAAEGLVKTHLKRDHTVYLELTPEQLGRDYGMVLHFSRGIGDFFAYDGLALTETRLIRFERIGDQVYLIHRNPRFIADEGSPTAASLEDNIGHSIIHVAKIESIHKESGHLLVNFTEFFVSDYAQVGEMMKIYYGGKPISFEKGSSYIEKVQAFPRNVEIDAALSYKGSGPPIVDPAAVSDYRSLPVALRYSIFALPDDPMRPRLADDRVGHFTETLKDFSRDTAENPFIHYVSRWRLEKKDATADVSEPVKPIVYYIDRSVPLEYRQYVREGLEAWNDAFEGAGFKDAIVVKDPPENDSTWSAEDIRYSTIRWSAAHRMGFAIGPSQTDPRTGEILNADVLISAEFVRGWLNEYEEMGPEALSRRHRQATELYAGMAPTIRERLCFAEAGTAHQLGFQHAVMAGLGEVDPGRPIPEEYLGQAIRWLVMHEVGHTLGMRHNFKASSGIPYDRLHDESYTGEHGVMLSVMDYPATNINPDRSNQGHYWNTTVGTYDDWAIRYAYKPVAVNSGTNGHEAFDPTEELPELRRIAREASDPLHTYGTDEDNWLGAWAVDPFTNANELGSNPLQFARDRAALVAAVTPRLEERLIEDGDRYYRLRNAQVGMLGERVYSLLPVIKMVGAIETSRSHKGDPGAGLPFTPVPAEQQREAVELIVEQIFAPDAFVFDEERLNKLMPNRMVAWYYDAAVPVDFPAHAYVNAVHEIFVDELMHPARFQRMIDNELRMPGGTEAYRVSEMLTTLSASVWDEVHSGRPANSFRRNLQRRYTDQLIRLMLDMPAWSQSTPTGVAHVKSPEHVRSLSRLELTELRSAIANRLDDGSIDRDTRAHLMETTARIDKALDVGLTLELK